MSPYDPSYALEPVHAYGVVCVNDAASPMGEPSYLTEGRPYMVTGRIAKQPHLVQVRNDLGVDLIYHESRFEKAGHCTKCNERLEFFYGKDLNQVILEEGFCFKCRHFKGIDDEMHHVKGYYIIDGVAFYDHGDGTTGFDGTKGYGGSRFYIIDNDGNQITTDNLSCLGKIPPAWQGDLTNNAWFANYKWEKVSP